jgi:Putative peptidoglycan binding domain
MTTRYHEKADAVVAAWTRRYGSVPSKHAVLMCCAVAEHETSCGDAWNHAGNWGAIQRRTMTPAEKDIVKQGGKATPSDAFEQLHGDSSPINGRYQTWFWAFPAGITYPQAELAGDAAGAWKLLDVLLEKRPSIKALIDVIDVQTLASNMYHTHYYEGFHDPRQPGGVDKNIADYANALHFSAGRFATGLSDWEPLGAEPPSTTPAFDLTTLLGVQQALNQLKIADPPLKEDGLLGPKTREAVMTFQRDHALTIDAIIGQKTRTALEQALKTG